MPLLLETGSDYLLLETGADNMLLENETAAEQAANPVGYVITQPFTNYRTGPLVGWPANT